MKFVNCLLYRVPLRRRHQMFHSGEMLHS